MNALSPSTGMNLRALLQSLPALDAVLDLTVTRLQLDSRAVIAGDVFVALQGTQQHGIAFAATAIRNGAIAVLVEVTATQKFELPEAIANQCIRVTNLRHHLGCIASRLHGDAQAKLRVVGVTGTNGKTSTVQLLAQALEALEQRTATIGTLGIGLHGALQSGARTTPDVLTLHAAIAELVAQGATNLAMEVSSHALDQERVAGLHFDLAIFTNLTRDHLDYHGDMVSYGAAKAKLFHWPNLQTAIINIDDAFGRDLVNDLKQHSAINIVTTGIESTDADVRATEITANAAGIAFTLNTPWGTRRATSSLLGHFNVSNLLGVSAALGTLGWPLERVIETMLGMQSVRGRMNRLGGDDHTPLVVVDYAHTPDGLKQALQTLRAHTQGQLICVFGCGGERDKGKRPQMAAIAETLSDTIIITDDNPRRESGDAIVADIVSGLRFPTRAQVQRDRARAIALALAKAQANDTILIAGKGHETYQEVDGVQFPFDDLTVAQNALAEAA